MLAQAAMTLSLTALIGLLLAAAYCDVASFTIPNKVCLAVFMLAPGFWWSATAVTNADPAFWTILATGGSVFLFGFLLFALGVMGGGDVKLMAALGFWMGPKEAIETFTLIVLAGGVLALGLALYSLAQRRFASATSPLGQPAYTIRKQSIPYGVAIAVGGLFYAGQLIINALAP